MILISITLYCTSIVNQREYKYLVVLGGPLWILLPKSWQSAYDIKLPILGWS